LACHEARLKHFHETVKFRRSIQDRPKMLYDENAMLPTAGGHARTSMLPPRRDHLILFVKA
jgi:hypothetical protein